MYVAVAVAPPGLWTRIGTATPLGNFALRVAPPLRTIKLSLLTTTLLQGTVSPPMKTDNPAWKWIPAILIRKGLAAF